MNAFFRLSCISERSKSACRHSQSLYALLLPFSQTHSSLSDSPACTLFRCPVCSRVCVRVLPSPCGLRSGFMLPSLHPCPEAKSGQGEVGNRRGGVSAHIYMLLPIRELRQCANWV